MNAFIAEIVEKSAEIKNEAFQSEQGVDSDNHSVDNVFDGKIG